MASAVKPLNALGAASVAFVTTAISRFNEVGSALDDMSQRTGVSVEALSQLSYVAEQNSTSMEALQQSLIKMAAFMDAAKHGSKDAIATLKELGLTYEDLKNMPADEQLKKFADALSHTTSKSTQSVMAMKVFGKGAVDLLPMLNQGSAGISAMMAEADRLGITMSGKSAAAAAEFGDSLDRLKASFNAIVVQVGSQFTPILTDLADGFAYLVGTNGEAIRTGITLVSVFGSIVVAVKAVNLATQAYTRTAAIAQALSGPKGLIVLAAGIAATAAVTYELNAAFDESNQRMSEHTGAAAAAAGELDNLSGASTRAANAIGGTSDSLTRFRGPSIDAAELDSYGESAKRAAEELDVVRDKRQKLAEAFRNQGGMGGDVSVAMMETAAAVEAAAAKKAKAANELYGEKFYAANAANRNQSQGNLPAYRQHQLSPELPAAKFDNDSLKRYREDAERATRSLEHVRDERKKLEDAFRDQGGMGGEVSVGMIEGIAFQEAEAFRAAKAASEFAANKIAESSAAALAKQSKAAGEFASSFKQLKHSLLTSSESAAADFKSIYDSWSDAGAQSTVRFEEMLSLQTRFAEAKSGFIDSFRAVTDELRILKGEITAAELELEKMKSFGVGDKQIAKLRELRSERDGLQKDIDQNAERKKNADDKLKTLSETRDNVLESLMTPVEKALAEFKSKAADVNAAVSAGLLDPAKAVAYLAEEQKRLSEGFVGEKFKQASNTGIDAKSQQANNMLVDLANRRGNPTAGTPKDQQTELQRQIAKEAARTNQELAGMRLEALRRETMQTKPFNQRS